MPCAMFIIFYFTLCAFFAQSYRSHYFDAYYYACQPRAEFITIYLFSLNIFAIYFVDIFLFLDAYCLRFLRRTYSLLRLAYACLFFAAARLCYALLRWCWCHINIIHWCILRLFSLSLSFSLDFFSLSDAASFCCWFLRYSACHWYFHSFRHFLIDADYAFFAMLLSLSYADFFLSSFWWRYADVIYACQALLRFLSMLSSSFMLFLQLWLFDYWLYE